MRNSAVTCLRGYQWELIASDLSCLSYEQYLSNVKLMTFNSMESMKTIGSLQIHPYDAYLVI